MLKLSDWQQDTFRVWLSEKHPTARCLLCGERRWQIGDHFLFHPEIDLATGAVHPETGTLLAFIACENCAFVLHFHSGIVGLEEG
jgi:hypothetical protein